MYLRRTRGGCTGCCEGSSQVIRTGEHCCRFTTTLVVFTLYRYFIRYALVDDSMAVDRNSPLYLPVRESTRDRYYLPRKYRSIYHSFFARFHGGFWLLQGSGAAGEWKKAPGSTVEDVFRRGGVALDSWGSGPPTKASTRTKAHSPFPSGWAQVRPSLLSSTRQSVPLLSIRGILA